MRRFVVCLGVFAWTVLVGTAVGAKDDPVSEGEIPKTVKDALLAKFP